MGGFLPLKRFIPVVLSRVPQSNQRHADHRECQTKEVEYRDHPYYRCSRRADISRIVRVYHLRHASADEWPQHEPDDDQDNYPYQGCYFLICHCYHPPPRHR